MTPGKTGRTILLFNLLMLAALPPFSAFPRGSQAGPQKRERNRKGHDPKPNDIVEIPADSPQLKQLKIEAARALPIPGMEISAPGRIVFDVGRIGRVLLPFAGRIDQVLVRLGDTVSPGQLLLTIDSPDADAAVAECRYAEAQHLQARSALAKAQADYNRAKDLFDHKAIPQKELLAAENEIAQARAEMDHAEASIAHCKRRLEILGLRPNEPGQKLSVRAPLKGKIIDLSVTPGEYRSDTTAPLMTVADLSVVWVTSEVPESSIRFIDVGERVQVDLVAYPGEIFDARVTRIADTVDPKTRTVQVQAELPNPRGRLRPEMFGRILHSHESRLVPVVPVQAIVQSERGPFLFLERGPGRFERTYVQTGDPVESGIPVLKGLKAGERIVTGGVMLLMGGMH